MNTHRTISRTRLTVIAASALLLSPLALAGCAQSAPAEKHATASESDHSHAVTVVDGWAKANADSEMATMTGAFGTVTNDTHDDLVLESAESDAAGKVELHQTNSDGKMSEVDGGFSIPAGASFELAPGGNHIMLMDMKQGVSAGDEITITLRFSDGSTLDAKFLVKDYSGANENYDGGSEHDGESGHDAASGHDAH